VASVTRREAAAWIDTSDDFDPASIAAAGVELTRLLWVSSKVARSGTLASGASRVPAVAAGLKAAEWILAVGGFALVILDFGASASQLSQSAALRLARAAEQSGVGVLVLASRRICGTFAALSLTLRRERACFSRLWSGAPVLFDGLRLEACVTRNKLGRSGQAAKWETVIEALGGAQRSRAHQVERSGAGEPRPSEVSRSPGEPEPRAKPRVESKGNKSARCVRKESVTCVFNKDPHSAPKDGGETQFNATDLTPHGEWRTPRQSTIASSRMVLS
jgi:hypothetical protein